MEDQSTWHPKTWVAVVLAIFVQPLAMLYLTRVWWALAYFLAIVVVTLAEFYLKSIAHITWLGYFSFTYVILVVCVVHAYRTSRRLTVTGRRPWYSRWYGLVGLMFGLYAIILTTRVFFYEPFRIPSAAMLPNYPAGGYVLVKKWDYGNYRLFGLRILSTRMSAKIERGDVIVFDYPPNPKIKYVKRVIGLPGEKINYINKQIFIDGVEAKYNVVERDQNGMTLREVMGGDGHLINLSQYNWMANGSYTVPQNSYFVLGDNRDNSKDSRVWGFVPRDHIIGKVVYTFK